MSDACIVCLGDLSTGIDGVAEQHTTLAKSPNADAEPAEVARSAARSTSPPQAATLPNTDINHNDADTPELIAHLQPCGHHLHNECLKPWVERANSCPICRASFHMVELIHHIGGNVISSYAVAEKTQIAEADPSLFLEVPDEEDEHEFCQECHEGDNEDILMYCDGCGKLWHTYCVDLDEVPYGSWFCDSCANERATDPQLRYSRRQQGTVGRRRTRGLERRRRNHNATNDDGWNQVWQSVWSNLSLDLDFPWEEDENPATLMRRHRQTVENNRREHEAWERRMRVAELAGGPNRFRETESTLLEGENDTRRHAGPTAPPVETAEETAAWDAFAEARDESSQAESSSTRKRKRKSRTSSPVAAREPSASPARETKRRRTSNATPSRRQPQQRQEPPQSSAHSSPPPRSPPPQRFRSVLDGAAPSFLQSLLQEVENSADSSRAPPLHRPSPRNPGSPTAEQQSPRPSSPATSNPSSPRALSATPPPQPNSFRPSSPPGLSSTIQPVFPPASFSPRALSPKPKEKSLEPLPSENGTRAHLTPNIARPKPRRPRVPAAVSSGWSHSNEASPTRVTLSSDTKADVQKLVSAALRPLYHEQKISKDEYTLINRDVSRMLYDRIGDFEALDLEGKAKWEKVAGDEVHKAVTALRT